MKILIVDDHPMVCAGLSLTLQSLQPRGVRVLVAATCWQAFELAQAHPDLDLVLLDYLLPDLNGLDALAYFGKNFPALPVLMMSAYLDAALIDTMLAAGACGFLPKSSDPARLLQAVEAVLAGYIYRPPTGEHAEQLAGSEQLPCQRLSGRKREVLRLLIAGASNKDISRTLDLAESTVKYHVGEILKSLGVQNRQQAILQATRQGIQPRYPSLSKATSSD